MGRRYNHGIDGFKERLMDYLFDKWDSIKRKLEGRYISIFLDFDGTLASIAETPAKAVLPEETRRILRKISNSKRLKLAFISGRALKDIRKKIGLRKVVYSGNHGLETEGPKIKFKGLVPPGYRVIIRRIKDDLLQVASSIKGAFVEDKGISLAFHYRLVNKRQIPLAKKIFHKTVTPYLTMNKIKVKSGKMVLEITPPFRWDKGKIVLWLLKQRLFAVKTKLILPIYIGDDLTDEDAFKTLRVKGLTVFVGRPKDSYAKYYLRNQDEVAKFLKNILCLN
jgi:trehalose-phosphatase